MVQYFVIYLSLLSTMIFAAEQPQEVFLDFSYPTVKEYVVNYPKQKGEGEYSIEDVIKEILPHKDKVISLSLADHEFLGERGLETLAKACEEHHIKFNILDLSSIGLTHKEDLVVLKRLSSIANYVDITDTFIATYQWDEDDYNYISKKEFSDVGVIFLSENKAKSKWENAKIHDRFDELPLLEWHKQYYALKKEIFAIPSSVGKQQKQNTFLQQQIQEKEINIFPQQQTQMEEEKGLTQEGKPFQREGKNFPQSPKKKSVDESTRSNSPPDNK